MRPLPVCRILVPWDAPAVAFGLADEVGREQGDVRAGDRLDDVQNGVVEGPLQKLGVHEVRDVHSLRPDIGRQFGEDRLEIVLQPGELRFGKHRLFEYQVAFVRYCATCSGFSRARDAVAVVDTVAVVDVVSSVLRCAEVDIFRPAPGMMLLLVSAFRRASLPSPLAVQVKRGRKRHRHPLADGGAVGRRWKSAVAVSIVG